MRERDNTQDRKLRTVMTAREVAETFSVSRFTVQQACKKGWIPAYQSGATWIMLRSDAQARWGASKTESSQPLAI